MSAHDQPRVSTEAVDAFLREQLERPLLAGDLLRILRGIAAPSEHDPALVPYIRLLVWRWCRAAGQAVGRVGEDESLEQALADSDPCPWTVRLYARPTPTQRALLRQGATSSMYGAVGGEGIALLPPTNGSAAARWCEAFSVVATDLVFKRAPRGPDCLRYLEDPSLAQHIELSEETILAVEEVMVDQAQRVLLRHGHHAVVDHFTERYGLTRREGMSLVLLAKADARLQGKSSVEDDRALMIAQLQGLVDRARESMHTGDELRALRELARVQGLTRTEPEDRGAEFLGVVRRVAGKQDAMKLLPAAAEALGLDPDELAERADEDEGVEDVGYRLLAPREKESLDSFDNAEAAR